MCSFQDTGPGRFLEFTGFGPQPLFVRWVRVTSCALHQESTRGGFDGLGFGRGGSRSSVYAVRKVRHLLI